MNSNRAADPRSGPSQWVNPQRTDRRAPRLREIDLNSLPYVPLPRAPTRWGTQSGRAHPQMQEAEALFELRDAPWQLAICAAFAAVALADSLSTRWAAIRLSSSTVVGSSASRGRRTAARFISISMLGFLPREFFAALSSRRSRCLSSRNRFISLACSFFIRAYRHGGGIRSPRVKVKPFRLRV